MKKCFIYISVAVTLAFCLWLAWRQLRPPLSSEAQAPTTKPSGAGLTQTTNAVQQSKASDMDFPRPAGIDDAGWRWLKTIRKMSLERNQPIEFYARCVDQNGQPVEGARLNLVLTSSDDEMFKKPDFLQKKMGDEVVNKPIELVSDTDGWISLKDVKGYIVDIRGLSKEGYLVRDYYGGVSYEPHGVRNPSSDIQFTNAWNSAKGYTFHLWKKGETEPSVPISVGINMNYEIQGQWVSNYFVQFAPARVEWTNFAGADMAIEGIRRSSGNPDLPYEFTFTLTVPNGGILLSEDAYPYHAPRTGYQTSWSFENKPQNNPPDYPWTKTAYLKLRGGNMLAGVRINFCLMGAFDISFIGNLNPTGSRNLEPDPEKLIADPAEIQRLDEATRAK